MSTGAENAKIPLTKPKEKATGITERFSEVVADRHEYAQQWKNRTGGRVVGTLCSYVPEEVFYAGGVLPVRILGSHEPEDITSRHIFSMFCAYCRDTLAQGLQGRYHYLDGVAFARCCVHSLQTFDSWRRHVLSTSFYVHMPEFLDSPSAKAAMGREVAVLKGRVEQWTGQSLDDAILRQAVAIYNYNRELMRAVYELRKRESPPISGAQCMEMVLASQIMDKAEHNRLVEGLLGELQTSQGNGDGVRMMLVGQTDNVDLVRFIESMGIQVVMDDLCFGSRYFWNTVPSDGDIIQAVADRYVDRPRCPMKDLLGEAWRPGYVLKLAQEYGVQGALLVRQQFCDPHEYEAPAIKKLLEGHGIPCLIMEQDITIPLGQLRTRLEAHVELIESAR